MEGKARRHGRNSALAGQYAAFAAQDFASAVRHWTAALAPRPAARPVAGHFSAPSFASPRLIFGRTELRLPHCGRVAPLPNLAPCLGSLPEHDSPAAFGDFAPNIPADAGEGSASTLAPLAGDTARPPYEVFGVPIKQIKHK